MFLFLIFFSYFTCEPSVSYDNNIIHIIIQVNINNFYNYFNLKNINFKKQSIKMAK